MAIPVKSSIAERRRPTGWDAVVVLFVVALACVLAFAVFPRQTGAQLTAVVTVDGETLATIPLYEPNTSEESSFYPLDTLPYPLTLEYKTGAIRVSDAYCPGRDCEAIGWIDQVGEQIVCLPNRLIITLTGDSSGSFDAVTG